MNTRLFLSIKTILLFTMALLIWSQQSLAGPKVVGYILATGEGVTAKEESGKTRVLKRRSPVYEGDTILSGKFAVQIRLTDGSLTSLRPDTAFKIESYHWEGKEDGKEKGFFSLIKGGLRTITGLIGKKNKKNYVMKTPVATIGIRGTDYGIRYCNGNCRGGLRGLFGGVFGGGIFVFNPGGRGEFDPGNYFRVLNGNSAPERQLGPPPFQFGRAGDGQIRRAGGQDGNDADGGGNEGDGQRLGFDDGPVGGRNSNIPEPVIAENVVEDQTYTTVNTTTLFSFIHGNSPGDYQGVLGTVSSTTPTSETVALGTVDAVNPTGTFNNVVTQSTFSDNDGGSVCSSCSFTGDTNEKVKDAAERTTAEYTVNRGRWRNDGTTTYSLTGFSGSHSGMTGVSFVRSDDVTTSPQMDALGGLSATFSTIHSDFDDAIDHNGVVNSGGVGITTLSFNANFASRTIDTFQLEVTADYVSSGTLNQTGGAVGFSTARETGVRLGGST